jgi:guanylate kinase
MSPTHLTRHPTHHAHHAFSRSAAGMPSQRNQSESFRFKRAAFYQGLKSKVGLAAAKAAALRINLNVQGCSIVAAPMHAPSRTSLLLRPPSTLHTTLAQSDGRSASTINQRLITVKAGHQLPRHYDITLENQEEDVGW